MRQNFRKLNTRVLAVALAVLLLLCQVPAASAAETSGTCGTNLNWSFADGTLTITGSGAMTNYSRLEQVPWYSYREQIYRISLPEGLTNVGSKAFYDCINLTAIVLPSTVKEVGELAFCQCTSVTILSLNDGLQKIGRSAFELCSSLRDLRLPGSVTTLGRHAFYRCTSLQYVTVPVSVTEMGSGVFAYCSGLIRAEVRAMLPELPRWTFYGCTAMTSISLADSTKGVGTYSVYGCESLNVIYYGGEPGDAEELKDQVSKEQESFGHFGQILDENPGNEETFYGGVTEENGDVIAETTTVTKTDEVTVSVQVSTNLTTDESVPTQITATVIDDAGWEQVLTSVKKASEDGVVEVFVYIPGNADVPQSVVDALAGRDVILEVQNGTGSSYALDFAVMDKNHAESDGKLDLSYLLVQQSEAKYEELAGAQVFNLNFNSSSVVYAEVMIRLPGTCARKTATLYQINDNTPEQLQSVVVDMAGYAHFYVAELNKDTQYLIGIDVPGIDTDTLIIPEELYGEYGITDLASPIEYVITGRTSSWGMSGLQVGLILAAVMIVCVAGIGVFMYAQNKRKLKMGYVPDLDEEDLED